MKDSKEEIQARGFNNSITDMLDVHKEERDNNSMFRVLSLKTFGYPDFHKETGAQVVDNMTINRGRFSTGKNKL